MPTLGDSRVRTTFNPSQNSVVDTIKQQTAHLIDACEQFKTGDFEQMRCAEMAQIAYEEAAMWAVKAATFGQ